jgi:hypothetical protein
MNVMKDGRTGFPGAGVCEPAAGRRSVLRIESSEIRRAR